MCCTHTKKLKPYQYFECGYKVVTRECFFPNAGTKKTVIVTSLYNTHHWKIGENRAKGKTIHIRQKEGKIDGGKFHSFVSLSDAEKFVKYKNQSDWCNFGARDTWDADKFIIIKVSLKGAQYSGVMHSGFEVVDGCINVLAKIVEWDGLQLLGGKWKKIKGLSTEDANK